MKQHTGLGRLLDLISTVQWQFESSRLFLNEMRLEALQGCAICNDGLTRYMLVPCLVLPLTSVSAYLNVYIANAILSLCAFIAPANKRRFLRLENLIRYEFGTFR